MKKMKKLFFGLILLIIILFTSSCEELFTTISGLVSNDGIPISGAFVLALSADADAYERLSLVNELTASALSAITDVVKGFDLASDDNGYYKAILISEGTIYIIAISDENDNQELDSVDLIGWYGDVDTIKIPNPYTGVDSIPVVYTDPKTITIENGADTTGIDVVHMIEYWLLELVQEYIK